MLTIESHPQRDTGRLVAHDTTTGDATPYSVDRTRDGFRVLGLMEGITAAGSLEEARALMLADHRARKQNQSPAA